MKLSCFVFSMVLGICMAKSLERIHWKRNPAEETSQNDMKTMQMGNEERNGRLIRESKANVDLPHAVEGVKSQLGQIKDNVRNKLADIWNKLTGYDEEYEGERELPIDVNSLPKFPDPFEITSLYECYALGDVNFSDIKLRGLSSFKEAKLHVSHEKKSAVLELLAEGMQLNGKYELTSKVKNTKGDFQVNMYNNVVYEETFVYEAVEGNFRIISSESHFHYGKMDTIYENIGFFTQILEGAISKKLMADVERAVSQEVSPKLKSMVFAEIRESQVNEEKRKQLTEAIQEAVHNAQQQMSQYGDFKVELKDEQSEEMKDGDYWASLSTTYLSGLEKFSLENVNIEKKDHKIVVQLDLKVDEAPGYAFLSVRHLYNENEPFQKINVAFKAIGLRARVSMTKDISESSGKSDSTPELADITVDVDDIRPQMEEHYEGAVRSIIRDQMPAVLKRSLSKTLGRTMHDDLVAHMFKGVLPPITSVQQQQDYEKQIKQE